MASRAFFRCRACGEPVVAGAYRCPNCAIDFPAGTPGAPSTPDSPAAVDPSRPERRAASDDRPLASDVPARIRADMIASRLDSALVAELAPPVAEPEPVAAAEAPAPDREPAPAGASRREADALGAIVPAAHGSVAAAIPGDPGLASRLDAVPGGRAAPASDTADADLRVAPGRERAAPRPMPAPERAAPRPMQAPEPATTGTALVTAPRRRSKTANLVATVALALVALAGAGAALLLLPGRDTGAGAGGPTVRVVASDGWVDVPPAGGSVRITADGPYRVRLDGVVYHVTEGRTLNIPTTETTQLAIRTAGGPTVAEAARAE